MAKVSVIIPVYNADKYLRECLDSVVGQTLKDIEIICVNDGSTDASPAILEEYAKSDKCIKVISKPNAGYGHSMNVGFDAACGEYIGIVESDDFAELEMFEVLYNIAYEYDADVVKSNFFFYYSKPKARNEFFELVPKGSCGKLFGHLEYTDVMYRKPSIWSAIYKREFIYKNGIRFTETPGASYQDAAFNFKVWSCAERIYFVHEAYLHYRQDNELSSVNSKSKVFCVCDEYDEMARFLEEHPEKKERLECLMHRIKYDSYMWNYDRIGAEFKLQFLERMAEEFRDINKNGKLDRDLFEPWKWKTLNKIMESPSQYHLYRVMTEKEKKEREIANEVEQLRHELQCVYNSKSFKIGRFITYVPRKLRITFKCIQNNGVRYTLRRIFETILVKRKKNVQ